MLIINRTNIQTFAHISNRPRAILSVPNLQNAKQDLFHHCISGGIGMDGVF